MMCCVRDQARVLREAITKIALSCGPRYHDSAACWLAKVRGCGAAEESV